MPKSIIKPRSATKAEWEAANPILNKQEIGYEVPAAGIGKGKIKMKQGDGVTAWKSLPYACDDVNADEMVVSALETISEQNPTINAGSTIKHYISVIKKKIDYCITLINSKIGTDKIYNALDSSDATKVLAAPTGKQLKQLCDNNTKAISDLNSDLGLNYDTVIATQSVPSSTTTPICNKWLEPGVYIVNANLRMDLSVQTTVGQVLLVGGTADGRGSAAFTLPPGKQSFARTSVIEVKDTSVNVVLQAQQYHSAAIPIEGWLSITKLK